MPRQGKRQLNVWLSPDALNGWRALCDQAGIESLSAMVEAVGVTAGRLEVPEREWPAAWPQIIAEAKAVEARRRSRAQTRKRTDESTGKSGGES